MGVWYCQKAKDPRCSGEPAGFCVKSSPKNACAGCYAEEDCGQSVDSQVSLCQKVKDSQCGQPGAKGWCAHWAKANSCQASRLTLIVQMRKMLAGLRRTPAARTQSRRS